MSSQFTLKMSGEKAKEMPMVDLAFMILKSVNTPMYYRDIMQEIAQIKGIGSEEVNQVIAQLYTEINIDGRFACVGANLWGLKRWYPIEKAEDPMGTPRPRIINDDDDDDIDDDYEEEESFDNDSAEDYDGIDEEEDEDAEIFDDEDTDEIDEELEDDLEDDMIEEDEDESSDDLEEEEEFDSDEEEDDEDK